MKILYGKSTNKPLRRTATLFALFCLLWLAPEAVLAQDGSKKIKSLEQEKEQATVTINGKEIPVTGHNNISKLMRMLEKNNSSQVPVPGLEDIRSRDLYEWMMLRDPETNRIPSNIHDREMNYAKQLLNEQLQAAPQYAIDDTAPWERRGPYNVGGRTRALAIDRTDTTRILAGGVSGGMWLSTNGGDSWIKTTDPTALQSVTCIAQDPTDENGLTWYYGTGEIRGNSAAGGGAPFRGDGVFKSTDGGLTWSPLASTLSNTPHIFEGGFDYVHDIEVDPTNGDVWAAAFGNVFQSKDQGVSWDTVFTNGGTWTDLEISASGDIVVSLEEGSGPDIGVFYKAANSSDFAEITPPELQLGTMDRTIVSISPSDENILYLIAHTPGSGFLSHTLMKYTIDTDTWENRSANLPAFGGPVGNYNSQGAYDILVEVHPTNPDIVFIGGTNLYRSTDGFATTDNTDWIGGYATLNNVSIYPNQHPDQHVLTFYPNSPNAALSGNDGGVQLTTDILNDEEDDTPVNWISLNNGYYTSQPYAISIDPSAENPDLLMAGFQDNGTWLSTAEDAETIWTEEFGGDGSFNAMADGGRTRLVSSQNGNTFAFYYADANDPESQTGWTRITPAGAAGFSFVNPFILDPNSEDVLYMATSDGVWRNSNYTAIPLFNNGSTSVNWSQVPGTEGTGAVTTLEASTFEPNILYYGNNLGQVFRVDNVHTGAPEVEDVTTGKGLPSGAVSGIAVDPEDADRVLITMSNYNIRSIFFSEDGGQTWADVSGNLEEAENGIGAGPSVRWVEMLHTDDGTYYLAGTSTGLYSTQTLVTDPEAADETEWELEAPDLIGNVVIRHMAVRPFDGTIAVATHANGMYDTQLPVTPEDRIFAGTLDDIDVVFGTDSITVNIAGLFEDEGDDNSPLDIQLYDITNDSLVAIEINSETEMMKIIFNDSIPGIAGVTLSASSDDRIAFSSFSITVEELEFGPKALFDQISGLPTGPGITSQVFTDFGVPVWSADDFEVQEGETWEITQVNAPGTKGTDPIEEVVVQFWLPADDADQLPEIIFFSDTVANANGPDDGNMRLNLRTPVQLDAGYYWVSITPVLPFNGNRGRWFWSRRGQGFGSEYHLIDPGNLFGQGWTDWTGASDVTGEIDPHLSFTLNGIGSDQEATEPVATPFATAESPTEIELEWEAGPFDLAYIISTSDDGENFTEYAAIRSEEVNEFYFEDLDPNTTYYYGIQTIDVTGDTTAMAVDNALTFPETATPGAATNVSSTGFSFAWDAVATDEYVVLVGIDGDEDPIVSDTIMSNVNTYDVTGLDPATEYLYLVVSLNETGTYELADPKEVLTLPSTPTGLMVGTLTNNTITLEWETNDAEEGVEEYQVLRGLSAEGLMPVDTVEVSSETGVAGYEDATLEGNTQYFYGVKALIEGAASELTSLDTLTFPNVPATADASAITNVSMTANWTEVSGDGYLFDFATDDQFSNLIIEDSTLTSLSLMVNELSPAQTYYYRVRAFNATGNSEYSATMMGTTTINTPANFAIGEVTQTTSVASWDAVEGVSDYQLDVATSDDFSSLVVDNMTVSATTFDITGLDINTEYFARVRAVGTEFNSDNSATVNFMTLPNLAAVPTNIAVIENAQSGLDITWDLAAGDVVDYIIVERSVGDDQNFEMLERIESAATSFTDTSLPNPFGKYFYRVSAGNRAGESDFSDVGASLILSIDDQLNAAVSVWPNPANDKANLRLNQLFTGEIKVNIVDASGLVVETMEINKVTTMLDVELKLAKLSRGIYFVQVLTSRGNAVKRLMKR